MRRRRGISTKTLVALLSLVLLLGCSLSGTLAWLADKTDPVTNTFTVGDVNIELDETTGTEYKIVPGVNIAKDPKVTVKADSEACWLFVKVDEANWPEFKESDGTTRKVKYAIADGWDALEGETGVYYRQVGASDSAQKFYVLAGEGEGVYANGMVTVSSTLTKSEVQGIGTGENAPTLTFTAYAVQQEGVDTPQEAWDIAKDASASAT